MTKATHLTIPDLDGVGLYGGVFIYRDYKSYFHHLQMAVYLFLTKVKSQMDCRYLHESKLLPPGRVGMGL